ncbi:MAG: ParB/RepB/Spo0J family partition protein [Raoultibacter sp.]
MVKQTKGGLGRGLSSLLGESVEEAGPVPVPARTRERTIIKEEDVEAAEVVERAVSRPAPHPTPAKPVQKNPVPARESIAGTSESLTAYAERRAAGELTPKTKIQQELDNEPMHPQPYIEDNDHVTIKRVLDRKPDEVPLESIKPNPDQPRTNFNKEELEELAASIEKEGLLQPILVRAVGNQYQIIAGERRWQACSLLHMKMVPVRIKEATDDKALELALIENIQRSDLNPIEEAYGYRRLMERQHLTQSEVALAVSKGRSTVANALRLLDLPEDAQQLLFEGKITAGHARAILSIPSKEGRQKLTEKLVAETLSVREAETLARLITGRQLLSETPTKREPAPKSFKTAARGLREVLGTNVRVKTVQGKNKIEIEFKDEEDLERLFEQLTKN